MSPGHGTCARVKSLYLKAQSWINTCAYGRSVRYSTVFCFALRAVFTFISSNSSTQGAPEERSGAVSLGMSTEIVVRDMSQIISEFERMAVAGRQGILGCVNLAVLRLRGSIRYTVGSRSMQKDKQMWQ